MIDDEGNETIEAAEEVLTVGESGIDVVEATIPDGEYEVGFLVSDLSENLAEEYVPIRVKRE